MTFAMTLGVGIAGGFLAPSLPVGVLEASLDGNIWKTLAELPGSPQSPTGAITLRTHSFEPEAASYYHLRVSAPKLGGAALFLGAPSPPGVTLSELVLHTSPRVNHWEDKAGFGVFLADASSPTPGLPTNAAIDPHEVIDLTSKMQSDGTLDWQAPAGDWTILRFGYGLTGERNHPATPTATGLEVDKFSSQDVASYAKTYTGMISGMAGDLYGKSFRNLLMDSWEAGNANWTERMAQEFQARRGYSLTPYLPVLTGLIVGSPSKSDAFLCDFRRTLAELLAENHYGTFTAAIKPAGIALYAEAMGTDLPTNGDGLLTQKEVSAIIQLTEGETQRCVTARYVIGCDGASSSVRRLVGVKRNDLIFDEPWLVVDVHVHESGLLKLPRTAAHYCNPKRPTTFIVGPRNHCRWEIMLSPDEDPRDMEQAENVWRLLSPWLEPVDGTLWRASSYRFHALLAASWRSGRVFLAGDAAHQQPPFIGQGMCQGARDVTNLCWKLTAVLQGSSKESLLDTYEEERSLHVHTLTSRIKAIGHHICERDPVAARKRDAALLLQGGGQAPTVTRQEIVPPLEAGLLASSPHSANGTLFPQPWIITPEGLSHLDVLSGHGWRLIVEGRHEALGDMLKFNKSSLTLIVIGGESLQEKDGIVAQWFDRYLCFAAIVRPDHYVYGVAQISADTNCILADLRVALDPVSGLNAELGKSAAPTTIVSLQPCGTL